MLAASGVNPEAPNLKLAETDVHSSFSVSLMYHFKLVPILSHLNVSPVENEMLLANELAAWRVPKVKVPSMSI